MPGAHIQVDGVDGKPASNADRALEQARRAVNYQDPTLATMYAALSTAERLMSICDVVVHTCELVEQVRDTCASIADQVAPTETVRDLDPDEDSKIATLVFRMVRVTLAEHSADPKYAARVANEIAERVAAEIEQGA